MECKYKKYRKDYNSGYSTDLKDMEKKADAAITGLLGNKNIVVRKRR